MNCKIIEDVKGILKVDDFITFYKEYLNKDQIETLQYLEKIKGFIFQDYLVGPGDYKNIVRTATFTFRQNGIKGEITVKF